MEQMELELSKLYRKVVYDRLDADTIFWDNIEVYNRIFREKLLHYTSNYPETLTYKFDSLKKDYIYIVSSDDSLFRIYSWDTYLGGTMVYFENIFQFKAGGKVYAYCDTSSLAKDNYIPFYSQIFTLKTDDKTCYLAVNNGIYTGKETSQSIKAFSIENNSLNDTLKLFKIQTESDLLNEIDIYFDFFSVVDRPERSLRLIKYNPDKKIIYIPVVAENDSVTNKYTRYKFNGQYFEPRGKER
jgi:hypothetical protein